MRQRLWRWVRVGALPALGLLASLALLSGSSTPGRSLGEMGIHLGPATSPPAVSREEAVAIAAARLGGAAGTTARVTAKHVLFTDEHNLTKAPTGERLYQFRGLPAWVVTFSGTNYPVERGLSQEPQLRREVNLVVDAETGEAVMLYTYR